MFLRVLWLVVIWYKVTGHRRTNQISSHSIWNDALLWLCIGLVKTFNILFVWITAMMDVCVCWSFNELRPLYIKVTFLNEEVKYTWCHTHLRWYEGKKMRGVYIFGQTTTGNCEASWKMCIQECKGRRWRTFSNVWSYKSSIDVFQHHGLR